MRKSNSVCAFLCILFLTGGMSAAFTGCFLLLPSIAQTAFSKPEPKTPRENGKSVIAANLRSPETATLFFGSTGSTEVLMHCSFIQSNPDTIALVCSPGLEYSTFWFHPLPVNSNLHLVLFSYRSGDTIYTGRYPMNIDSGLSFFSSKPGLQYIGHNTHTKLVEAKDFLRSDQYGFVRSDIGDEERDLRRILKYYSGTDWEPVIQARLEELKNGN